MASVNKVILIGNLGKDPEIKHLDNGTKLARFTVATHENVRRRDGSDKVEQTDWHNIVILREGLADLAARHLTKAMGRVRIQR